MNRRKKLVVISHTEHYFDNGEVKGWGPTINEINYLADYWEEVVHVGCLYHQSPPSSSLAYTRENIRYVPIPAYGGKSLWNKLGILIKMPRIIWTVKKQLRGATEVQLRTPTAMGLFLLPLFTWFWKRNYQFWVKYAGDWEQERPPRSNGWQRWFLQQNWINFPVTINGFWPHQKSHCYSFENPCLYFEDINEGAQVAFQKKFSAPFNLVFVGRIDDVKGLDRLLEAVALQDLNLIREVIIVGDGPKRAFYQEWSLERQLPVSFTGFLQRNEVHKVLHQAHFILLPSSNEGFPKVIAEAACYGVLPVVSNVSSIKHYIDEKNGFIWDIKGFDEYSKILKSALDSSESDLITKSKNIMSLAKLFTFDSYYKKLNDSVFKD
jgi:glycosyltransferase involved in cell wall biosynthesis